MRYTHLDDDVSDTSSVFVGDDDDNISISPTDGYFASRDHPQDLFIERPSIDNTSSSSSLDSSPDSKQRPITPQPSTNDNSPTQASFRSSPPGTNANDSSNDTYYYYIRQSPPLPPPPSSGVRRHASSAFPPDETTPLLHAVVMEAPPPYDAEMGRAWRSGYGGLGGQQQQQQEAETNDGSSHGGGNGNGDSGGESVGSGLLAVVFGGARWGRRPEAMASPSDFEDEEGLYGAPRRKQRWSRRRCLRAAIVVLGVLSIVLWVVMSVKRRRRPGEDDLPQPKAPKLPGQNEDDPFNNGPSWPSRCGPRGGTIHETWNFDKPDEFSFTETIPEDMAKRHVDGEMYVVAAPLDQAADIRVKVAMVASRPFTFSGLQSQQSKTSLQITDAFLNPDGRALRCLSMLTVIYVKPGLSLSTLHIESSNNKLIIYTGPDITVRKTTTITLANGGLSASPGGFDSSETIISITNGGVSGTYTLRDLLSIKTQSGPIGITLDPKKAHPEEPKPADLQLRSVSGSINVNYATRLIPGRDYRTVIDATLGSFTGSLVHGSSTAITTTSGSITGIILPLRASNRLSTLSTHVESGSTRITLLSPYLNPGANLTALRSSHSASSGSISLDYPREWSGELEGGSSTGSVTLRGKGLDIIQDAEGGGAAAAVGQWVRARKGSGGSKLSFETTSGSCTIQVGVHDGGKFLNLRGRACADDDGFGADYVDDLEDF